MKTHLRALHPEIFNELILLKQKVQSQRDLLSDQRKLNEKKAEKYPSQSQIQLQWDMNILQLLVETELPFALVEHPGFRQFMIKVDPKVTIKSANTFAQQKLPLMTRTIKDTMNHVLERDLQQYTAVAMTSDHWTSRTVNNIPLCETRLHIKKLHNPVGPKCMEDTQGSILHRHGTRSLIASVL